MPDNGNQTRPVRTLTVKNFSVIKEATLEFGKITVLIGPQASGKSLLCKLAYFLGQILPTMIEESWKKHVPFDVFIRQISLDFVEKFPENSWTDQQFKIGYIYDDFSVRVEKSGQDHLPQFRFSPEFVSEYEGWSIAGPGVSRDIVPSRIRKQLEREGGKISGLPIVEESVYIPTGRSFYSITNRAYAILSTKNLDWIMQAYAPRFDADYKALRDSYNTDMPMLSEFGKIATRILKGRVISEDGRLVFESIEDSRSRPFEILSSGALELLPLINSLSQITKHARYPDIPTMPVPPFGVVYIEEPELSVFPSTQAALIRLFVWLAQAPSLWMSFAITTHSPYILSAFDNLIKAGVVGNSSEEHRVAVNKIVDEKYWIRPEDFRAYKIVDGKLDSIYNPETGDLDADYLDNISGEIAAEFSNLLEIQYGK
jgi:hypothetical protein